MHGGSGAFRQTGLGGPVQAQPSVLSLPARWKGHQPAGAGLSNLGNSCYLNSTLQCLAYVPPLAHLCLGRGHSSSCSRAAASSPAVGPARPGGGAAAGVAVPCTFCLIERQVAALLRGSRSAALSPSEVVRHLHLFSRSFVRGRQEDSHELLTAVLDVMERDGRRAAVALGAPKGCRTIVEELFLGRWQSQVRCLVCGYESNTYESFATLPLDIGQARTVSEGLRVFTEAERLDGHNKYKCDKCRQLVPALKQTTIWDDPNVLVLHLKRFDPAAAAAEGGQKAGGGGGLLGLGLVGKISRHVAFPESIDLAPFMTPPAARRRAMEQHKNNHPAHHHQEQQYHGDQQHHRHADAAAGNGHHHHQHSHNHQHEQGGRHANGVGAGVEVGPVPDRGRDAGSDVDTGGRSVYSLTGVLVHRGTSLHSGHYYAFVRDSAGGWSCMNDSHVYGTSLEQVRQEQAYLLFYTRQSMKMPRPVPMAPPPPTAAAEGRAAASPLAAAVAAAVGPVRQVYGPQLPLHVARGSPTAAATGSAAAGELPLPQRPSRLNPAAAATPSARLPAKVSVSPRQAPVAAAAAAASTPSGFAAAAGRDTASAATIGAAAPLSNGRGSFEGSRKPDAPGASTSTGISGARAAPAAVGSEALNFSDAAAAPEREAWKRKRGEDDGGAGSAAAEGGGGSGEAAVSREEQNRLEVAEEVAGLKACASWTDGIKRLKLGVEARLRESGLPVAVREAVLAMKRSGMSLQQVLAVGRGDPRRRALDRVVPQGVLQHGTDELRKLLRPLLMLLGWLGGPVPVLLL